MRFKRNRSLPLSIQTPNAGCKDPKASFMSADKATCLSDDAHRRVPNNANNSTHVGALITLYDE